MTITLILDESESDPWNTEKVTKMLKRDLDMDNIVTEIEEIEFPNGLYGDFDEEDFENSN